MRTQLFRWTDEAGWSGRRNGSLGDRADLLLLFGGRAALGRADVLEELTGQFPEARLLACSTAGEISGTSVTDDSIVGTAVTFESTALATAQTRVADVGDSHAAGLRLAEQLEPRGLAHVFVLSTGLGVNGSELVAGLSSGLPAGVSVTGGLSGDGERFEETLVRLDDDAGPDRIAALGLYGDALRIGYGSLGGWDPFGPLRTVTRADGNVLFELDGKPALRLYREYLGEHASGLPATGLLFPLSITRPDGGDPVVRTILAVDDEAGSITFAGDLPTGSQARLMKANFDRLVDGAAGAARGCHEALGQQPVDLAILISCVGRKLVLKQRIEEEVEAVRDTLGEGAALTGFYSYGEISPATPSARCQLHNQTMTITTLSER